MAKTSAIITYTDANGKAMQKTLTDINPEATNTEIKTFAQKMVGMTDNVYVQTDRVDKVNCDSEAGGGRQTPTLTVADTNWNYQRNDGNGTNSSAFTYSGDGTLYITQPVCTSNSNYSGFSCHTYFNTEQGKIYADAAPAVPAGSTFSFQLGATETDNFKAPEPVTITITFTN